MKSIKLLMATAMLAIGSTAAMAQASYTDKDGNEYQFKRHWFLDIQAGGQYTVGEASFSDFLSPNFRSEERRVGKECRSRWSPYH